MHRSLLSSFSLPALFSASRIPNGHSSLVGLLHCTKLSRRTRFLLVSVFCPLQFLDGPMHRSLLSSFSLRAGWCFLPGAGFLVVPALGRAFAWYNVLSLFSLSACPCFLPVAVFRRPYASFTAFVVFVAPFCSSAGRGVLQVFVYVSNCSYMFFICLSLVSRNCWGVYDAPGIPVRIFGARSFSQFFCAGISSYEFSMCLRLVNRGCRRIEVWRWRRMFTYIGGYVVCK
jgi:hypothetical protein